MASTVKSRAIEASNAVRLGQCWHSGYLSIGRKLRKGIWPYDRGFRSRLPEHYKQRYLEKCTTKPHPVHFIPDTRKFTFDEHNRRIRFTDTPIPVVYPPEADLGLWGGEGIIEGFRQKFDKKDKPIAARIWTPFTRKRIFYSEILDKWMAIIVTTTAMNQIDEMFGFDYYILKTHEVNLKSKLGMKLRREMLYALTDKSLYPNDPAKREHVYDKYKQFIILREEIEWLGLDINEAEKKQMLLEELQRDDVRPMKEQLYKEFLHKLENNQHDADEEEARGWMHKFNPFKKEQEADAA